MTKPTFGDHVSGLVPNLPRAVHPGDILMVEGPDQRTRVRVRCAEGATFSGSVTASWNEASDGFIDFIVELTPDPEDDDEDDYDDEDGPWDLRPCQICGQPDGYSIHRPGMSDQFHLFIPAPS